MCLRDIHVYLSVNHLTRFSVCQILKQAIVRGRLVAHGAATILLPSPLLYLTKTTRLGLGEGRGGADWVVFGPDCPLEFPQELTKTCVQVPPSGIDLTGLGRCLHLSFLFCCLVRGERLHSKGRLQCGRGPWHRRGTEIGRAL